MNEQLAATAQATTRIVEDVVSRSKQTLEELVTTGRDHAEKVGQAVKTGFEEIKDLSQQNVSALMASSTIVARGVEEAGQEVAAFSQQRSEASLEVLRKLATVTSLTDAVELQQSFAKASVTALISETERLSAMMTATARNAFAPINDRVTATVALVTRPVAA
jgi:phasin family protein